MNRKNPLITPKDIKPTREDFEVVSVLNPAVTTYKGETILLLRVAERPRQQPGFISIGVLDLENGNNDYKVLNFKKTDPLLKADDPRVFTYDGITYLSIFSHLRIARSRDGYNFTVDSLPFIWAHGQEEEHGVEDARITFIDGVYYIYYVAVTKYGFSTMLATTTDFRTYKRISNIAPGINKDVAIFPEKIGGKYFALMRPDTGFFAKPSMWIASSPDLEHWGKYSYLFGPRKGMWDSSRIGAGTVPIRTKHGWLEIYHGADNTHRYSLGITLLDIDNPGKVLYRSEEPILQPEAPYELDGFFSNVVFTNGAVVKPQKSDDIFLYYGAADQYVCGALFSIEELLSLCQKS